MFILKKSNGVCSEKDTPEDGAKKFIAAIRALNARMNIPDKITGIQKEDISGLAKYAEKFAKRKTVATSFAQFHFHSCKQPVPYENTLIINPWNYPFLLTLDPNKVVIGGDCSAATC